ncbi:glyoxalase domain-containing protein [Citrus sinensis]|uniref:Glyoxalase domain-containing protein n=1 Tax=Citrus sinensis TaxID=2711 RepID=A0ACB8LPF9_CITSI|nr:glyoxalase domain-containing protein [Citrus sinensis]
MAAASFRWILQLHKDVPKAARFYSEGLDFTVNVCTLRWAELQSGPLKLALMQSPSDHVVQNGNSSLLSFTVTDINSAVTKLMALGAELDGSIKYEIHGKVAAMRCIDGFTRAWQPLDDRIAYAIARRLLYLRTVDITLPNPM